MSKPNRAFAHLAKRPFTCAISTRDFSAAAAKEKELRAAGHDVKTTRAKLGPSGIRGWTVHRVWFREKEA